MTGFEIPAGAGVGVTVAKFVVQQSRPGLALAKSIARGKTVVVVGPSRAGKTTFLRYTRYKVLGAPAHTHKTDEPETAKHFRMHLGEGGDLQVAVKRAVDLPGQYTPDQAAQEVHDHKAQGLVILLDLSAPLEGQGSSTEWLVAFCDAMNTKFGNAKPRRNRLRSVIVAMNKMDLIDEAKALAAEEAFREVMTQHWRASGPRTKSPLYRRCIAVENARHGEWMNRILADLAFGLKGGL